MIPESKFVQLVNPRNGSVLLNDNNGIWINIQVEVTASHCLFHLIENKQVLGVDMDSNNNFVRIFFDGTDSFHDTNQLSGRVLISDGNHTVRVELHVGQRLSASEVQI